VLKLLLLLAVVAGGIYLIIRAIQVGGHRPPRHHIPRSSAPDDDIDFLRDLDKRRRDDNDES
jgi:hypothetical protein